MLVDTNLARLSTPFDDSSWVVDEKKARVCGLASKEEDVKIMQGKRCEREAHSDSAQDIKSTGFHKLEPLRA